MAEVKEVFHGLPRNKYLDENSKKLLEEFFPLADLESFINDLFEDGKELTDEGLQKLLQRVYEFAFESTARITGDRQILTPEAKRTIHESLMKSIKSNPYINTILRESHIRPGQKISLSKIKESLDPDRMKEIGSKKENIEMIRRMFADARNNLYSTITGPTSLVKQKVDTIYEISKKIYSAETLEDANIVFSSELNNRIISTVQRAPSLIRAVKTLTKKTKFINRDVLVDLKLKYDQVYNESELLVKLLSAIIRISERRSINTNDILNDSMANHIDYINKRYPDLIGFKRIIRNASHTSGTFFLDFKNKIRFLDNKEQLELSLEDFFCSLQECGRYHSCSFTDFQYSTPHYA